MICWISFTKADKNRPNLIPKLAMLNLGVRYEPLKNVKGSRLLMETVNYFSEFASKLSIVLCSRGVHAFSEYIFTKILVNMTFW